MSRISASISLLLLSTIPAVAVAQDGIANEIRALIVDEFATTRATLKDDLRFFSRETTYEFWSSGGLLQVLPGSEIVLEYDVFSLHPKHIQVIVHGDDAATAMFYSEGAIQEKGRPAVADYRTRVTRVYVKEGDRWVPRTAHYSPIAGGSGTNNVAPVDSQP